MTWHDRRRYRQEPSYVTFCQITLFLSEIDWYQNEWPWPLFRGRIKVTATIALHLKSNISETIRVEAWFLWRYKISGHCSHCSHLTGTGLHDAHTLSAGVGWGCSPRCCLSTDRLIHTVNGSGWTRHCVSQILYTVIYTWCGFGSSYATERFSRNFHCLPETVEVSCF